MFIDRINTDHAKFMQEVIQK